MDEWPSKSATALVCLSVSRLAAYGEPVEGTPFGRYRLIDLLGRGGMGEVWRAYDPVNARYVALKVLPANYADDQVSQERFRREARAAAGLDDPHVVPIYDSGEIEGRLFVSMKLIKGHDLQALVDDGPLPPARAVSIIEQIASALHTAHEVDLVHRDVKPSNILVAKNDFAYLIDFGIARAAGEAGLTSTGSTIGTWAYMAPERFQQGIADARADIYALACVLHQALTGEQPFPGRAIEQIAVAHMLEPPPRPSESQAKVPAAMDEVIAAGMAKDPERRYQTATELAAAAEAALTAPTSVLSVDTGPAVAEPAIVDTPHSVPPVINAAARPPSQQLAAPSELATPTREPAVLDDAGAPSCAAETLAASVPVDPAAAATQLAPAREQSAGVDRQQPSALATTHVVARSPGRPWLRRPRNAIIVAVIVLVVATISITAYLATRPSSHKPAWTPTASGYGQQTELPFTGLGHPEGVAVDALGSVYVADQGRGNVVKLAAGSNTQTVLPFTGLNWPAGVAVDSAGTVYMADRGNGSVKELLSGSSESTSLSFEIGTGFPAGVAVDTAGNVFVTIWESSSLRVVKLAAGSHAAAVLPFTDLSHPEGVAVDAPGSVYVADYENNRVVKLAAGSHAAAVLPFTDLSGPAGVAVDSAGFVYIADSGNDRVLKLAGGPGTQTVLPFTGLSGPTGVAVDSTGTVFVTDTNNKRVLKLPVQ
jgi:serine/threonine-protein kinase